MKQKVEANKTKPVVLPEVPEEIEIFPYGLSIGPDISRPLFIFQDESGEMRIPIRLGAVEAAAALSYLDERSVVTPFAVLSGILEHYQARVEKCVLDQVQGHRQMGALHFKGKSTWSLDVLRGPADELVSVGLTQKARFYATPEFARDSREMNLEIQNMEAHLKAFPQEARKSHRFLM